MTTAWPYHPCARCGRLPLLLLLLFCVPWLASPQGANPDVESKYLLTQPPRASTRMRLPDFFPDAARLGDIASRISDALSRAGYTDQGWFVVPSRSSAGDHPTLSGFAVVTRLEQIENDGQTKAGGQRWTMDFSSSPSRSILDSIKLLLQGAPDGRYRVFLLWVSNDPVSQIATRTDPDKWQEFLAQGAKAPLLRLMQDIRVNYGAGGGCYAFVYEYERSAIGGQTKYVATSQLTAEQHLKASGIWDAFSRVGNK